MVLLISKSFLPFRVCNTLLRFHPSGIINTRETHTSIYTKKKIGILNEVLGLNIKTAKLVISSNPKLLSANLPYFRDVVTFIQSLQLNISSKKYDQLIALFKLPPPTIQQHVSFLNSCGKHDLDVNSVIRLPEFMMCHSSLFKAYLGIDENIKLHKQWICSLPSGLQDEVHSKLNLHTSEVKSPISLVRNVIFACYLASEWTMSFEESLNSVNIGVKENPMDISCFIETLDVLKNIGYDHNKIMANPEVLRSQHTNVKKTSDSLTSISGKETSTLLCEHPMVCLMYHADVDENLEILKRFKIPVSVISENIGFFLSQNPAVLRYNLKQIVQCPEMKDMCHSPDLPKLLEKIDTATTRLKGLMRANVKSISLDLLCSYSDKQYLDTLNHRSPRF